MRLEKSDPETFFKILDILSRGGIVIMPCDTIYGIVGAVPETEERIRNVKGREEAKPFLQLIASEDVLGRYTDMHIPDRILMYWPGPLTLIVPDKQGGTTALRIPEDPLLVSLMERLGKSLYSTSVNRSGAPILWKVRDIVAEFSSEVDLIVTEGDLEGKMPSTILDITATPYRVLRQGALRLSEDLLS